MEEVQLLVVTAVVGLFVGVLFYVSRLFSNAAVSDKYKNDNQESAQAVRDERPRKKSENGTSHKKVISTKQVNKDKPYTHPWLLTSLKGHSNPVLSLDISPNDKFLASSCSDRSLLLWPTKQFSNKDHKCYRGNVAYDHGANLCWSPDGKALIVHKVVSRQIEVYKLAKKESSDNYSIQPAFEFPILHDADDDVIALDIDTNGKYIMTCSTNKNDLVLCDLKGTLLSRLDTFQMTTYYANISPCGKYVAASGFTPDVKVWSVKFTKSGDLDKVARAFELTGHTSGVYHFAWRNDSARMATVSKDGTWRVYNVDVDHHIGQYTKLISSGKIDALPSSKVALSPDGRVLAISVGKNINVYSADPAKLLMVLTNVHTEPISGLLFDAEARWLISAGDKHIRVFHNVIGFQKSLVDFKKKLTDAKTEGHKERLTQQIDELKSKLKDIGQPEEHD